MLGNALRLFAITGLNFFTIFSHGILLSGMVGRFECHSLLYLLALFAISSFPKIHAISAKASTSSGLLKKGNIFVKMQSRITPTDQISNAKLKNCYERFGEDIE